MPVAKDTYKIWRCFVNKPVTRGASAGGCFSTTDDLTKIMQAIFNGSLVKSKHLVHEAISAKPAINSPFYDYGFFVSNERIMHGGDGTGVDNRLMRYNNGLVAVILSNYSGGAEMAENIIHDFCVDVR